MELKATKEELRNYLTEIIKYVDYDVSKEYDKNYAESPDEVDHNFKVLEDITEKHLNWKPTNK